MFTAMRKVSIILLILLVIGAACAPAPAAPVETQAPPADTQAPEPTKPPEPTEAPPEPTKPPEPTEAPAPEKTVVIGMVTIASHPSLDNIQKGVKDALAEAGFVEGENLKIIAGNAQGDMATMNTIVQGFIDEKVDLIVATTTPAAQTAYKLTQDVEGPPVFYNGVSNPFGADLATTPEDHPAWVIGNQLMDPIEQTLGMVRELLPEAKTLGMVYNPAEANSVYLAELAQKYSDEMGFKLETAAVSNTNEISTAAESLLGRDIDAFFAINDNTVTSGFEAMAKVANENKIPLIGTSASMPGLGAALSYGVNPYQEGLDSGAMVVAFLNGELDIATAPVKVQEAVLLTVNPAAAELQGLIIPEEMLEKADVVIE